jgi:hypothetical protein
MSFDESLKPFSGKLEVHALRVNRGLLFAGAEVNLFARQRSSSPAKPEASDRAAAARPRF